MRAESAHCQAPQLHGATITRVIARTVRTARPAGMKRVIVDTSKSLPSAIGAIGREIPYLRVKEPLIRFPECGRRDPMELLQGDVFGFGCS